MCVHTLWQDIQRLELFRPMGLMRIWTGQSQAFAGCCISLIMVKLNTCILYAFEEGIGLIDDLGDQDRLGALAPGEEHLAELLEVHQKRQTLMWPVSDQETRYECALILRIPCLHQMQISCGNYVLIVPHLVYISH